MTSPIAIAIHAGTGTLPKGQMTRALRFYYERQLKTALYAGLRMLCSDGSAVDAVQAAVVELEAWPAFDASGNTSYSESGGCDLDAAIMDGSTMRAGVVGGLRSVRNPIRLARMAMDSLSCTPPAGESASYSAGQQGLYPDKFRWLNKNETVGAVALDSSGHLAAASSSKGAANRRYNNICSSCLIGIGTYADDHTCAVSRMEEGLITLHRCGQIEMPFCTEGMYRACVHPNGKIEVGIY